MMNKKSGESDAEFQDLFQEVSAGVYDAQNQPGIIDQSPIMALDRDGRESTLIPSPQRVTSIAMSFAQAIIPMPEAGATENRFFKNGAQSVLTILILYYATRNPQLCNPADVFQSAADTDRCLEILRLAGGLPNSTTCKVMLDMRDMARSVLSMGKKRENYLTDFIRGVVEAMPIWGRSGFLGDHGRNPDALLASMRQEPLLIVSTPDIRDEEAWRTYNKLMVMAVISVCKSIDDGLPITCIFDEFSLYEVHGWSARVRELRGFHVTGLMSAQGYADLKKTYGEDAAGILIEQASIVQYGVTKADIAADLSKEIGTVSRRTYTIGTSHQPESGGLFDTSDPTESMQIQEQSVPIMSSQDILKYPGVIVKVTNGPYFKLDKLPVWEQKGFCEQLEYNTRERKEYNLSSNPKLTYDIPKVSDIDDRKKKERVTVTSPVYPKNIKENKTPQFVKEPRYRASSFIWLYAWIAIAGIWHFAL